MSPMQDQSLPSWFMSFANFGSSILQLIYKYRIYFCFCRKFSARITNHGPKNTQIKCHTGLAIHGSWPNLSCFHISHTSFCLNQAPHITSSPPWFYTTLCWNLKHNTQANLHFYKVSILKCDIRLAQKGWKMANTIVYWDTSWESNTWRYKDKAMLKPNQWLKRVIFINSKQHTVNTF